MYKNNVLIYNNLATTKIDVFNNTLVECSGQREYYYKGATTMEKENLIGRKFNRLTVINYGSKEGCWLCECDCGNIKEIREGRLLTGHTKSCGCLRKEKCSILGKKTGPINGLIGLDKVHKNLRKYPDLPYDDAQKRLLSIYGCMIKRCDTNYKKKNIKICDEWLYFPNFYNWAINNGFNVDKPWYKCTIDRINNNGNYEPNNCRFVDMKVQSRNKSNNRLIAYNNITLCVDDWLKKLNITYYELKKCKFSIENYYKEREKQKGELI